MNIQFDNADLTRCQEEFNKLDPEKAIVKSHFDLAKDTAIHDTELWKNFLKDVRVSEYLNEEIQIFKEAQQRKLIQRATSNDKSVGTAQMINALGKVNDTEGKGGNLFVYSYVPLNTKEVESPYATAETTDVFETEE